MMKYKRCSRTILAHENVLCFSIHVVIELFTLSEVYFRMTILGILF